MTPWTFLAWVFITLLYAACWLGVWFASRYYGWGLPEGRLVELAVAIPLVCLILIALTRAAARLFGRRARPAPPVQQYAKGWADLAHLLGPQPRPVFLAVGEDDDYRRRLWLGRKQCRYLLDDASGLAMAVFPNCLWLDVPAAYLEMPRGMGNPAAMPCQNGAWEELAAFVPKLPGCFAGAALFVNPGDADPAWEAKSRWLGKKLALFFHHQGRGEPRLWVVASRFEDSDAGRLLIPAIGGEPASADLGVAAECARAVTSLSEILGAAAPSPGMQPGHAAARQCVEAIRTNIDAALAASDAAAQDRSPVKGLILLRHDLDRLGSRLGGFMEIVAESVCSSGARQAGLYLCGLDAGSGCLAFTEKLIEEHIPSAARSAGVPRVSWKLPLLASLLVTVAGAFTGLGYMRAGGVVDALPVNLLERPAQAGGFDGPPPVARYARARRILSDLEGRIVGGPAELFDAPQRGVAAVEAMFIVNLRSWLPEPGDPYAEEPWIEGLMAWAETEAAAKPIRFRTPAGTELTSLPGRYGRSSRIAAIALLDEWGKYLEAADRHILDGLGKKCDAKTFAAWEAAGEALGLRVNELAVAGSAPARDAITANAGVNFVEKAGDELSVAAASSASTRWLEAVMASRKMMAAAAYLNGESVSFASLPALGGAGADVWNADEPSRRFDAVRGVADAWRRYRGLLFALYPAAQSDAGLAELAAKCFDGRDAEPGLTSLHDAWTVLASGLVDADAVYLTPGGESVLTLLGQGDYLFMDAAVRAAAEGVQRDWEEKLLSMPAGMQDEVTLEEGILIDAALQRFLEEAARPYLAIWRGLRLPSHALGMAFPWTDEFIAWLQRWERISLASRSEYPVRVRILPVTVNAGANKFPRGVTFSVDCTDKPVSATTYNYQSGVFLAWNPKHCGEVKVSVHFDDHDVERVFPGPMGFADFLHSLRGGRLEFAAEEYPEYAERLAKCGIDKIVAAFAVVGGDGIRALGGRPPPPPLRVVP